MKMDFNNFFGKKGKIYLGVGALALVLLVGGGIFVNSQLQAKRQEELRIAEQKAKEEKEKEEQLAKAEEEKKAKELEEKKAAEEEKAKKEQEKKEKAEKEKEEKEKESKKAKVDERESKGYNGQSENKVVNNKSNSNNKNTNTNTNSKKNNNSNSNSNSNSNNNNSNKNNNTFEVEEDENTYPPIGNSGMFFNTRSEAESWVKAQVANENSIYWKNGYKSWWVGQCKHNGKIGWTISFR